MDKRLVLRGGSWTDVVEYDRESSFDEWLAYLKSAFGDRVDLGGVSRSSYPYSSSIYRVASRHEVDICWVYSCVRLHGKIGFRTVCLTGTPLVKKGDQGDGK